MVKYSVISWPIGQAEHNQIIFYFIYFVKKSFKVFHIIPHSLMTKFQLHVGVLANIAPEI